LIFTVKSFTDYYNTLDIVCKAIALLMEDDRRKKNHAAYFSKLLKEIV
jgi:hypothetical protein